MNPDAAGGRRRAGHHEYDYVVVGGGSAGCALAARLAADPSVSVVLLEAGRRNRHPEARIPIAYPRMFKGPLDWDYHTEPEPALGGRRIYWPRARTLGGCSAMNAMIYMRGAPTDYDGWAAAGCHGWSYHDVLPYFRRAEDNSRGASAFHGADGPLSVGDQRYRHPLSDHFVAAGLQLGLDYNDDFNDGVLDGVGPFQVTQHRGRRVSSAHAYLRERQPNLTVLTGVQALRVLVHEGRADGVRCLVRGALKDLRARRDVVLSAGAINSPQLLMLSGIGPADELRSLGVDVLVDLPEVGRNLQDHLAVALVCSTTTPALPAAPTLGALARYVLAGRGPLASNIVEAGAFLRSRPELAAPDLQLHFAPMLIRDDGLKPPTEPGFALWATLLRPGSRGRVCLRSADPVAAPSIRAGYLTDPADFDVLITGVRRSLEILAQPPLSNHVRERLIPAVISPRGIAEFVRQEARSLFHPAGTCAMGAVVDQELRVRGVDGLRVADASVMPTIVCGNTNAPAIMIGEKAADLIRGVALPGAADG